MIPIDFINRKPSETPESRAHSLFSKLSHLNSDLCLNYTLFNVQKWISKMFIPNDF